MNHFEYRDGQLFAEEVAVADIVKEYGSPCYIYSRATLERHWHAFNTALGEHPHLICYAVKANSNLAVLNIFARLGSGFDIVSLGELKRVLAAGGDPQKVVFSGVGKTVNEIQFALELGIRCFNVESEAELMLLNQIAGEMGKIAPVSLRVNPDVDAQTHPYISTGLKDNKFGINVDQVEAIYLIAHQLPHLRVTGVDFHIGSQLTSLTPFMDALKRLLVLVTRLEDLGIPIHHLDLGGGLGVCYRNETPPSPAEYASALLENPRMKDYEILMEPGRAITANAGILVAKVEFLKLAEHKNFAIVDAAMNDLIRPSLYQAWMDITPVMVNASTTKRIYDVVGPVCETSDFLGKERELAIQSGDLLAIRSAGAYGFSMSSNYNSRPRVAELLVDGDQVHLVRRRETIEELFTHEYVLPTETNYST